MQANSEYLLNFLRKGTEEPYIVPFYQRNYQWDRDECKSFLEILKNPGKPPLFGTLTRKIKDENNNRFNSIVDGQQRLTTVSLFIIAIANRTRNNPNITGMVAEALCKDYLYNEYNTGERRYKLILSYEYNDMDIFKRLIDNPFEKIVEKSKILSNLEFFKEQLNKIDDDVVLSYWKKFKQIKIIDQSLDTNEDEQEIYDLINNTGKKLSQFDRAKNYLFDFPDSNQEAQNLYEDFLCPIQRCFSDPNDANEFLWRFVTLKTKKTPLTQTIYNDLKNYIEKESKDNKGFIDNEKKETIKELKKYAKYYANIFNNQETNKDLKFIFNNFRKMDMSTSTPYILSLYNDYDNGKLEINDFKKILKLIESYLFRRKICAILPNTLKLTFIDLIGKGRTVNDFVNFFKEKNRLWEEKDRYIHNLRYGHPRFPSDDEFHAAFSKANIYEQFKEERVYVLEKLVNFNSKQIIRIKKEDNLTIEHIIPSCRNNSELPDVWKKELGTDWERIHAQKKDCIGNLTITYNNQELGQRSWIEKRDGGQTFKGICYGDININEGLKQVKQFNEKEVDIRTQKLTKLSLKIWFGIENYTLDNNENTFIEKVLYPLSII